jgi:CPA1 family monovalent cation:H+ antiporter
MRGVVSLAAALALPDPFPGRDLILIITFVVIVVTVLVQGSTLAPLIRALGLHRLPHQQVSTLDEASARARMAQIQLTTIEKLSLREDQTHQHPRLVEQYTYRARASARFSEAAGELVGQKREHFNTILAAVAAGRQEILRLHRAGSIHDSILHTLEDELDLDEMTARRHLGEE